MWSSRGMASDQGGKGLLRLATILTLDFELLENLVSNSLSGRDRGLQLVVTGVEQLDAGLKEAIQMGGQGLHLVGSVVHRECLECSGAWMSAASRAAVGRKMAPWPLALIGCPWRVGPILLIG